MASHLLHLLLALASATTLTLALEVPVTVYFESLCPDSQKFIKDQFALVYSNSTFQKYIKPQFVPWGHTNVTGEETFSCQHGKGECDGNRLLSCGLQILPDDKTKVSYVTCIMALNVTTNTTDFPIDKCQAEAGSLYQNITECYNNISVSSKYLQQNGDLTKKFFGDEKFWVPYISFNNKKDDVLSKEANTDFVSALCTHLKGENLSECPNSSASTFTATLIPAIVLLILGRL